ncbi:MAG TPA: hypothetical protein VM734_31215 [Kofleriaceae bacterium]|jgi:hypothetical protein|nr:hypothetical protein [Kofleriaceae bacterium]
MNHHARRNLLPTVGLALTAFLPACIRHAAPPPIPPQILPELALPAEPPAPGHRRVIVDADVPSTVHLVEGESYAFSTTRAVAALHIRRLCVTPCVVELPAGQHDLRFTVDDDAGLIGRALVNVSDRTTAVRVHLGRNRMPGFLAYTGGTLVIGGGVTAVSSLWGAFGDDPDAGTWRTASLVGLAAAVIGTGLWFLDRPILQSSSSTQWNLP